MWRLSWITFIFLPANCLLAAFGMNVKQLENMPDISWLFIWAVPFFMAILVMWYGLKYWFAASRDAVSPRRGVYESLFSELAEQRPEIWTRQGPRDYVVPATTTSSWKWAIMVWWTRNVDIGTTSRTTIVETEPIGLLTRFQRALLRRWTPQIRLVDSCATEKMGEDLESASTGQTLPKAMVEVADPAIVVGAGRTWRTISEDWAMRQEEADLAAPEGEGKRHSGILVEEGSDETKLQQIFEVDQGSEDAGRHSSSGQHLEPSKTFDWIPSDARRE